MIAAIYRGVGESAGESLTCALTTDDKVSANDGGVCD